MLSLGAVARSRTRLVVGRVSSSLTSPATKSFSSSSPRLSTPPKTATNGFSSNSSTIKYAAAAGIASFSGLVWISTAVSDNKGKDDSAPNVKNPASNAAKVLRSSVKPKPDDDWAQDEVTRILSEGSYSLPVRNIPGVARYDGTQLASNSRCEDRFFHTVFPSPKDDGADASSQWMAWAVLDGHAGWQTAELLKHELLPCVQQGLIQVVKSSPLSSAEVFSNDKLVQSAIARAFLDLDFSILKSAMEIVQSKEALLSEKVKKLAPAQAGSCALLSLYDPATSTLHVACTGDSRAVLGQKKPDGTWEAIPLSVDQTGSNEEEIARIYREHPGEDAIVKNGRVLGLMCSRAFGDSRWKWPLEFQEDVKRRFQNQSLLTPRYNVKSPPYITAEPVVTSTKIDTTTRQSSFLILATDGLWDLLSSQQGVDLVGKWLESRQIGEGNDSPGKVEGEEKKYLNGHFDLSQLSSDRFVEDWTTVQDDNAAVHLVRNALGGNHHELLAGRLAFSHPFSRHIRDDITVQVIFFGGSSPTQREE